MVRIRLRRMGAKKRPFYRMVVADQRTARGGRFIEILGYYDPTTEPPVLNVKQDRIEHWLGEGAQPSDTVRALLKKIGMLGGMSESQKKKADEKAKKFADKQTAEEEKRQAALDAKLKAKQEEEAKAKADAVAATKAENEEAAAEEAPAEEVASEDAPAEEAPAEETAEEKQD